MRSRVLIFDGSSDRKRKQFQKDISFWNLAWAINCDLPQSLKLMAFFPAEHSRLKILVKMILRHYISILKDTFCQGQKNLMIDYPKNNR